MLKKREIKITSVWRLEVPQSGTPKLARIRPLSESKKSVWFPAREEKWESSWGKRFRGKRLIFPRTGSLLVPCFKALFLPIVNRDVGTGTRSWRSESATNCKLKDFPRWLTKQFSFPKCNKNLEKQSQFQKANLNFLYPDTQHSMLSWNRKRNLQGQWTIISFSEISDWPKNAYNYMSFSRLSVFILITYRVVMIAQEILTIHIFPACIVFLSNQCCLLPWASLAIWRKRT